MPRPSTSLATLRPDLAGSLMAFDLAADRQGFIALRVLPVIEVGVQAGSFGKIPLEQLLQRRETQRASGSGYSRSSWKFEPERFATMEHGVEEPIDDREAKMYANYFDAEQVSSVRAFDAVLREQECRAADMIFNPSTFTPTPITKEWDDAANAKPIDDGEASVRRIWAKSGLWPNVMIMNRLVFRNLRNCEQIIERIASWGSGSPVKASDINAAMLARVFDVDEVIVAGSPKQAAAEGQLSSVAPIWSSEYAMFARICRTNDIREPGLGRIMHWGEDGSTIGGTVETYRDETIRGDVVRVRNDTDEKILYVDAADLLSNITTSA